MKYKCIKYRTRNNHKDVLKKESGCIIFDPRQLRENGSSYFGVQVLFKCQWNLQEIIFTVVQEDQMTQNTSNAEAETWCLYVYLNTYMHLLYNKQQQLKFIFTLVNLIIQIVQMTEHTVDITMRMIFSCYTYSWTVKVVQCSTEFPWTDSSETQHTPDLQLFLKVADLLFSLH